MTQDPKAAWTQKCEAEGLCELGVALRRGWFHVSFQQTQLITKKVLYRGKPAILLQNRNLHTLHCSLLNVSFMKSSTHVSSREMFNKSKQRKVNKLCWDLSYKIKMCLVKALWLSGPGAENGVSFPLRTDRITSL